VSEFDFNKIEAPEGLLVVNNTIEPTVYSQSRQKMFVNVLNEARAINVLYSKMAVAGTIVVAVVHWLTDIVIRISLIVLLFIAMA